MRRAQFWALWLCSLEGILLIIHLHTPTHTQFWNGNYSFLFCSQNEIPHLSLSLHAVNQLQRYAAKYLLLLRLVHQGIVFGWWLTIVFNLLLPGQSSFAVFKIRMKVMWVEATVGWVCTHPGPQWLYQTTFNSLKKLGGNAWQVAASEAKFSLPLIHHLPSTLILPAPKDVSIFCLAGLVRNKTNYK